MSAWAACRLVHEQVGIETVLHFPTRGRNVLRLKATCSARTLGVRNLFVCVAIRSRRRLPPQVQRRRRDRDRAVAADHRAVQRRGRSVGISIGEATSFFAGAAAHRRPPTSSGGAAARPEGTGRARFVLTQPVYAIEPLRRCGRPTSGRQAPLRVPIIAGVLPLVSSRHATFCTTRCRASRSPRACVADREAGESPAVGRPGWPWRRSRRRLRVRGWPGSV